MSDLGIKTLKLSPTAPVVRRTLIYGDPGAGKTTLIGTLQDVPEYRDILILDHDGGSITLLSRGDISVVDARDVAATNRLVALFKQQERPAELARFKTLVLDGFSELQKRDLADIAVTEAKKATGSGREKPRDADRNELLDYKINQSRMLKIARDARDIKGVNTIVTAWARRVYPKTPDGKQKKDSQPIKIVPDLTGSVADTVMGAFDNVWYLFFDSETDNRYLVTNNYSTVTAKTRDGEVSKVLSNKDGQPLLTNPTFPAIFKAYKTAYGGGNDNKGAK